MDMTPIRDDEERVRSLRRLRILDTPPSATFDRITEVAALLYDADIALISLVDDRRQWFLSRQGVDLSETPRKISFCARAVANEAQLYVPDAAQDDLFADSPLVTSGPRIRSYLGQPIKGPDGAWLGTLCVIDPEPNKFDNKRFKKLEILGLVVEDLIVAHSQACEKVDLAAKLADRNEALAKANSVFVAAEQAARIGSWEIDCETMDLTWSDGVYAIHAIPEGTPVTVENGLDFYAEEDRADVNAVVGRALEEKSTFEFEANLLDTDGDVRRVQSRGEYMAGDADTPDRLVGIIYDITESHLAKAALQRAADFDSLTDLYNRYAFDRILGETIKRQRATGEQIAVMLLDLDGFKAINDTFGHLIGDMVLEDVSGRLSRCLPDDVVVARWGGDEFVFIAPLGSTQDDVEALWRMLEEAVQQPFTISGRKLVMHATGGAEISKEVVGGRELVRRADLAMYNAKKRETGALHFYGEELEKDNREKQQAINEVREAIDAGRLYAGYQPIVDMLTGEIVGLEALMRLRTRNGNELTATNVMPAILDPHISREIGERMASFICADHALIAPVIDSLRYISLNATEADLLSQNFAANLLARLDEAGIAASDMSLEVTETMLMVNDYENARRVLCELKEAGMGIALDDFGTGFSSLTHLRDFPIDVVKIDRSFVHTLGSSHQSRLIVQAMIAMARSLDITVVAEGIEREEQRELLKHMGCRFGQGFLLGVPQPSAKFKVAALKNRNTRRLPAVQRTTAAVGRGVG